MRNTHRVPATKNDHVYEQTIPPPPPRRMMPEIAATNCEPFREVTNPNLHHYETIGKLGEGGFARAFKVKDKRHVGRILACKVPKPNPKPEGNSDETLWEFRKEVVNMKDLKSHRHLVRFVDAYHLNFSNREHEFAIIFEPVANQGTLQDFIYRTRGTRRALDSSMIARVTSWYGCLANGLAFLHQSNVRHKDIAPSNILLHKEQVVFSDFGAAFHFATGYSTTCGIPDPQQETFKAPEMMNNVKRNRSADVWSLGCVFCEILSVVSPNVAEVLSSPREPSSSREPSSLREPYRDPKKHARVTGLLAKHRNPERLRQGISISAWALAMLNMDPSLRPSASKISQSLCGHTDMSHTNMMFSCYDCQNSVLAARSRQRSGVSSALTHRR